MNVQVGVGDITITDLADVQAAVPIGVAANVCGVSVNVLAEQQDQRAQNALDEINRINL